MSPPATHLIAAAFLVPVCVAALPAQETAPDVKAAVFPSEHVLGMVHLKVDIKYFELCPHLAEIIPFALHLLEGGEVLWVPAHEVDTLSVPSAVAVLGTIFHGAGKSCKNYYRLIL